MSANTRKLNTLKNWDKNPRAIKTEDFARLKNQIQTLGLYKPFLITSDGTVLGGNMRLRACKELGIDEVPVSVVQADTDELKLQYALSDNDRAGYYDEQALAELVLSMPDIDLQDYKIDLGNLISIDDLLSKFAPEPEEDEAPEVSQDEPISKLGEVYQLGRHRVMCADSTVKENVERLMDGKKADMVFTDPPYGMDLDTEYVKNETVKGNTYDKVIGDDRDFNYQDFSWIDCKEQFWWGADYYAKTLPNKGSWFVWDKKKEDLDASIGSGFEVCWSKTPHKKEMIRILWSGFTAKERNESRSHPTQKPIELCKWFINKFSDSNISVLDLFLGSGSTLIACEQTNRTCYGSEIDPKYVDVIRKRYSKLISPETWEDEWQTLTPALQ